MLISSAAVVAGLILLVWSADKFIDGASATATQLGVSPLLVGLLIVGFGTSAPEMLVSAMAAWGGNPSLALGNALGSNITNIALVLGVTAVIKPLMVKSTIVRREMPVLLIVTAFTALLLLDQHLSFWDGLLLIMALIVLLSWSARDGMKNRNENKDILASEYADELESPMPLTNALFWLIAGLVILVASSRILVFGAVNIAQALGVSDLVIGLTIIAIGTSLPELAASISAARKGEADIAIGNIIGSNLFNLLGVIGIAALIHPTPFSEDVLQRDLPVMGGLTLLLFLMAFGFRSEGKINRYEGLVLNIIYFSYLTYLVVEVLQ